MHVTLADANGELLSENSTWQFNFQFDLEAEAHEIDSINLLKASGIDFERLKTDGISHERFAEQIVCSGLVYNPQLTWIVFGDGRFA